MKNLDKVRVRAVLSSGCGRATSLSSGLGWWFGGEGSSRRGNAGRLMVLTRLFSHRWDRGGPWWTGRWTVVGSARSTTGARSVEPCAANTPAATAAAGTLSSGSWRPCSRTTQHRPQTTFQCTSGWRVGWGNLPERKAPLGHGLVTALFPRGCGCRGASPWRGAQANWGKLEN